jgi:ubiquinone/menaquinone biosynthesis C-methylase UbiE
MEENELKEFYKKTFNTVAGGYDHEAMRYFPESAARIPSFLRLKGNEHVLDVGTGTGLVAIALSQALPHGRVTGIDLSSGMLEQAVAKKATLGNDNVTFIEMDMTSLDFPDDHFDAAVSSFSIFFINDMEKQLRHIARKVRTGGIVAVTTFSMGSFSPLSDIFMKRLENYDIEPPTMSWKRIATIDQCNDLFKTAGLRDVRCEQVDLGYYLTGPEDWWYIVWNAGFRGIVNQLSDAARDRFQKEHLDEIAALSTDKGIRLEMKIIYTAGTK